MKTMWAGATAAVLVACAGWADGGSPAAAPAPDAAAGRRAQVRLLVERMGAETLAAEMLDGMLGSLQAAIPGLPDDFWQRLRTEARLEDLVDAVAGVYAAHFTEKEIAELLAFYDSETGQKLVRLQPRIQRECLLRGSEWGRAAAGRAAAPPSGPPPETGSVPAAKP